MNQEQQSQQSVIIDSTDAGPSTDSKPTVSVTPSTITSGDAVGNSLQDTDDNGNSGCVVS